MNKTLLFLLAFFALSVAIPAAHNTVWAADDAHAEDSHDDDHDDDHECDDDHPEDCDHADDHGDH